MEKNVAELSVTFIDMLKMSVGSLVKHHCTCICLIRFYIKCMSSWLWNYLLSSDRLPLVCHS